MQETVLITGASSGFGKATASYLAGRGYCVYGTSRKPAEARDGYKMLVMDVTDRKGVREAVSKIIDEQQSIDVVINNAGIGIAGAAGLVTEEEVELQLKTNLTGVINVCSEVLPYMKDQRKGKIINISSIAGAIGLPYQSIYSASKFGMEGYSEGVALEVKKFNIDVIILEPGDFRTSFTANRIVSSSTLQSNDYKDSFEAVLKLYEKDEMSGPSPLLLAKKISKILSCKNPKLRYTVGNGLQRLAVVIKKICPQQLFQEMFRMYYKLQ